MSQTADISVVWRKAKSQTRVGYSCLSGLLPVLYFKAYFVVHSLAVNLYFSMSFSYNRAISGTRGSLGLGSLSSEQIDNNTWQVSRRREDLRPVSAKVSASLA